MREKIDTTKPIYVYDDCGRGGNYVVEEVLFSNEEVAVIKLTIWDDMEDIALLYIDSGCVVSENLNYCRATNKECVWQS